jgi:hypothetical protein
MATALDKDLVRESSIKIDGREIVVTLSKNQEISFKLKGMKSGDVSINIEKLYNQLTHRDVEGEVARVVDKKSLSIISGSDVKPSDNPMISLYELRTTNAISGLDVQTISKFDGIIAELISNEKEKKKKK